MDIHITGRHTDVGDALKAHIHEKIDSLSQYFHNVVDVNVVLKQEGHRHVAEVNTLLSGIVLRAEGEGTDFYIAIDEVVDKLVRQLKKYKGRLQKHRKRRQEASARMEEIAPIQAVEQHVEEDSLEDAPDDIFAEYIPTVVHKDIRDLQSLSVDEAVMQMDLMHMNFYIFQNAKTGGINVVYRREDGKISWIEPSAKKGKNAS
ncbi:MAG: ribosomal subunit interface protein [Magnetococcales bacterium]|nr:ribosomal subunit interface protein [Magnetococcales bacterium]